ncbi:ABC-three component system middle component 1 [Algoriphagus terrigena]|uniref:ABC-three component system middle component 1 n=1 Tax=Algoriphagus terrigena TaxID=344884 RepID=UPI00041A0D4C|nr:ABC-three component system middle component 1 [Algoriphagus terrigena]
MEQYLILRNKAIEILKDLFPGATVEFHRIEYGGWVTTVFVRFESDELIQLLWEEISNAVALYYQTKIETDFERWNLYLFYLSKQKMEKGLKYRIENDPISSRKIVIEEFNGALDRGKMEEIISNHITNSSLTINTPQPAPSPFVQDQAITAVLNKILADGDDKKKKAIDYDDLLKKIERSFKDEI